MTILLEVLITYSIVYLIEFLIYLIKKFLLKDDNKSEQKIYHGCFLKNKGGTNKLIEKGKNCISATTNLFWKYLEDIQPGVSTRSQEKKQKKV